MKQVMERVRRLPENAQVLLVTGFCAVSGALGAVAFLLLTQWGFDIAFLQAAGLPFHLFAARSLAIVTGSSLIVGLLLYRLSPDAAGSGIPQLKVAYWKELGFVAWKPVLVKLVAGVVSLAGGASLGREGPSVYVAGGIASNAAGMLGSPKRLRRGPVTIGAASGLAAAFNTPLAAITFVLEELIGDLNSRVFGRVVLAAVIGAFTVYALVGRQPAFSLPDVETASWTLYAVLPFAAAVASGLGVLFQRCALGWRWRLRQRPHRMPAWLRPLVGGLITWALGIGVFYATGRLGVFSLGYQDLSSALHGALDWRVAGLLVAAKLAATIACYSWGGCGGIFAPTLFLGGLSATFVAGVASHWLPLTPSDRIIIASCGMSACFGAVVRAPMTGLLMVFEMTHEFELVPALMIATLASQAVARAAGRHNFYDALLEQDGHEMIRIKPPRDLTSWQQMPVSAVARSVPVCVRDRSAEALRSLLARHPYHCFPVEEEGRLVGVASREALAAVTRQGLSLQPEPAVTCRPDQTMREVADLFIASPSGVMVVLEPQTERIAGLLTLHDLLRAQAAAEE